VIFSVRYPYFRLSSHASSAIENLAAFEVFSVSYNFFFFSLKPLISGTSAGAVFSLHTTRPSLSSHKYVFLCFTYPITSFSFTFTCTVQGFFMRISISSRQAGFLPIPSAYFSFTYMELTEALSFCTQSMISWLPQY